MRLLDGVEGRMIKGDGELERGSEEDISREEIRRVIN